MTVESGLDYFEASPFQKNTNVITVEEKKVLPYPPEILQILS